MESIQLNLNKPLLDLREREVLADLFQRSERKDSAFLRSGGRDSKFRQKFLTCVSRYFFVLVEVFFANPSMSAEYGFAATRSSDANSIIWNQLLAKIALHYLAPFDYSQIATRSFGSPQPGQEPSGLAKFWKEFIEPLIELYRPAEIINNTKYIDINEIIFSRINPQGSSSSSVVTTSSSSAASSTTSAAPSAAPPPPPPLEEGSGVASPPLLSSSKKKKKRQSNDDDAAESTATNKDTIPSNLRVTVRHLGINIDDDGYVMPSLSSIKTANRKVSQEFQTLNNLCVDYFLDDHGKPKSGREWSTVLSDMRKLLYYLQNPDGIDREEDGSNGNDRADGNGDPGNQSTNKPKKSSRQYQQLIPDGQDEDAIDGLVKRLGELQDIDARWIPSGSNAWLVWVCFGPCGVDLYNVPERAASFLHTVPKTQEMDETAVSRAEHRSKRREAAKAETAEATSTSVSEAPDIHGPSRFLSFFMSDMERRRRVENYQIKLNLMRDQSRDYREIAEDPTYSEEERQDAMAQVKRLRTEIQNHAAALEALVSEPLDDNRPTSGSSSGKSQPVRSV